MSKYLANFFLILCLTTAVNPVFAESTESASECDKTKGTCSVSCSEPMEKTCDILLGTLKATVKAVAEKDFVEMAKHLDENCTTYNVITKKTVVGRDAVVKDVREKMAIEEKRLKVPAIALTIDHPFAKITGDKAVVTFILRKEVGGANPAVFESHVTDVFVKRDGQWKKLHYCGGDWKRVTKS